MARHLLASLPALLLPLGLFSAPGHAAGSYQRSYTSTRAGAAHAFDPFTPFGRARAASRPPQGAVTAATDAADLAITAAQGARELVVIDAAVPDKAAFYRGLKPGVDVVEIDATRPGLAQLAQALAPYRNLAALHIVSHAEAGVLLLGSSRVDAQALQQEVNTLAALRGALADGADLLLYGCDTAQGSAGEALLDVLHGATGLDVAASDNKTGNAPQGGDWELEVRRGDVGTALAFSEKSLRDFSGVLAPTTYGGSDFCTTPTYSNYCANSPQLTSTDGKLTMTSSTSTGVTATNLPGAGSVLTAGYTLPYTYSGHIAFTADGTHLDSFVLTGFTRALTHYTCTNVAVIGTRKSDGTPVSDTIGWPADGYEPPPSPYTPTNLSGVALTAFRVEASGCDHDLSMMLRLRNFTIDEPAPANTAPTVDANGAAGGTANTAAFTEGGGPIPITTGDATLADDDDITSMTLALSATPDGALESIAYNAALNGGTPLANFGLASSYDSATRTYTITGTSSVAVYQGVLRAMVYVNISQNPTATARTVTITATDAEGATGQATATVNVAPVNDAPTLTATGANPTFVEGGGNATLFSDAVASTVEAGQNFTQLVLTVANLRDGASERLLADGVAIALVNGAAGSTMQDWLYLVSVADSTATVNLTGTLSAAQLQTLIDTLAYDNASSNPTVSPNRVVTITGIADSGGTSDGGVDSAALAIASTVTVQPLQATVTSVSSTLPNGAYKVGATIPIQVNFNKTVTVTGLPMLTLNSGLGGSASYQSGSGTSELTFSYTVQAGNASADLDANNLLLFPGGSITSAGGAAVLTLPTPGAAGSLGANKDIVIDGVVPSVTSVSSSTANGSYKPSDTVSIQVTFSEAVTTTGTPQLMLETGATDRIASYASGTGGNVLTFSYTVQAGDTSGDLDYASTSALALGGGTLRDAAGNDAMLTLAAPGTANSLGANKNLVIDGVAPSVSSIALVGAPGSTATSVQFLVTFSESVNNVGTGDFTLTTPVGTAAGTVASVSASSGSSVTVTVNGITGAGTLRLDVNAGNDIADAVGNPLPAYTSGASHTVQGAPSAPQGVQATASAGQAVVTFAAPASDGGSAITRYTATSTPGSVTGSCDVAAPATVCPITVTGLTNGTSYTFKVKAENTHGEGAESAASNAVVPRLLQIDTPPGQVPGMAGVATATLAGGGATCTLQAIGGFGPASQVPPQMQAPNGQFSFTADQCSGAVTITLQYPDPLPANVRFRKPDGAGGWFDPQDAATSLNVTLSGDRKTVTYTIIDNGLGDADATPGVIADPFLPVVLAAPGGAHGIPTLGAWGLGLLSALAGLLGMRQARRRVD